MSTILFIVFAGLAIGSAIAMVSQRNPLYSAISLIGVFIALASIYVTLAAPFIAAVQVIVYAGAIMVLVIFVIMLLNVEQEEPRRKRLRFLVPAAIGMAAILIAESARYQESCGAMSVYSSRFRIRSTPSRCAASSVESVSTGRWSPTARGFTMSIASTWLPGTTRAFADRKPPRRANDIAPTIAISNRIEVISNGSR